MHSKAFAAHHFLLFVTRSSPSASALSALCDLLCALFVHFDAWLLAFGRAVPSTLGAIYYCVLLDAHR